MKMGWILCQNPTPVQNDGGAMDDEGAMDEAEAGRGAAPVTRAVRQRSPYGAQARAGRKRSRYGAQARAEREERAFRLGEAIGRGCHLWFLDLRLYLPLAFAVFVPFTLALVLLQELPEPAGPHAEYWTGVFQNRLPARLLVLTIAALVAHGVASRRLGAPAEFSDCLRRGLAGLPAVLAVGLILTLAFDGTQYLALLGFSEGGDPDHVERSALWVVPLLAGGLGSLLLAIFAYIVLWAAIPAAVVERVGPAAAMARSWRLARDDRGKVLVLVLMVCVASNLPAIMFEGTLAAFGLEGATAGAASLLLHAGLATLAGAVYAAAYAELRWAREGAEGESLVAVFD